jgi:hypothetical protein
VLELVGLACVLGRLVPLVVGVVLSLKGLGEEVGKTTK